MSGETADRLSGWTVDTLHEHLTALVSEIEKRLDQRITDRQALLDERHLAQMREVGAALVAAEKAVNKAEEAAEKRFEAVNEFRGQLADQAQTFMPRSEAEQQIGANTQQLAVLDRRFTDEIHNLASRLDLKQGIDTGNAGQREETRASVATSRSLQMVLIALGSLAVAFIVGSAVIAFGLYQALHK